MPRAIRLAFLPLAVALAAPTFAVAAEKAAAPAAARAPVKVGDTVYVCGCGASCGCGTIQRTPGTCSCGSPLTATKVLRIEGEGDQVIVKPDGKTEQRFKVP